MHPKRPHSEDGRARPSGSRPVAAQPHLTSSSMPLAIPVSNEVYINILPPHSAFYPPSSSLLLSEINAHDARPLHAIDPTVSFRLRGQMLCQAVFHIYKNGHFVQQECAPMTVSCGPPISEPGSSFPLYTYSTTLVPQHWSLLCEIDGEVHSGAFTRLLTDWPVLHRSVSLHHPSASRPPSNAHRCQQHVFCPSLHHLPLRRCFCLCICVGRLHPSTVPTL